MESSLVAKTWIYRGLSDLFFAFECDDWAFEDHERFSEIMGLEKFLKAALLAEMRGEYEGLPNDQAKTLLNKLAMKFGHDFDRMLRDVANAGCGDIEQIKNTEFDGYQGSALVKALKAGYMETRYPVPSAIADEFPIEGTELTHDPLASSGITKFIYALCNSCFFHLAQGIDFSPMMQQFNKDYGHRPGLQRFSNLFWEERCEQYL